MAIFIPKMKRHSETEFCFILFSFLFIFQFDFVVVVVDAVVVDDVNVDIVVVDVAVVVFYLTSMAGPVLTILPNRFFFTGYKLVFHGCHTHTHTHT